MGLDIDSYSLDAVCRHVGIPLTGHHQALADATASGHTVVDFAEQTGATSP